MPSSKIIVVVFAAVLLGSSATDNSSSLFECGKAGKCGAAQKFNELLDATLLDLRSYKYNQTSLANAKKTREVPIVQELYLAGSGVHGSVSVKKAKEFEFAKDLEEALEDVCDECEGEAKMIKDDSSHIFWFKGILKFGNILFTLNKKTWMSSIAVVHSSIARETGRCEIYGSKHKCGYSAKLTTFDDLEAAPLPGPTNKGLFKVVLDLEAQTVFFTCISICWPYQPDKKGQLFVMGKAVCGEGMEKAYKDGIGVELIKDADSLIYRATVHMCPGGTSFKISRAQGSKKKTLGLLPGPMHWKVEERNDDAAKGGKGDLTQYGPEDIPGPEVEADYEVIVDMKLGTVEYVCTGDMCAPEGPEVYAHEDPILEKESAFVHLFGWRWPDVAMECEQFLGPKGYRGVQIQPPQESKVPKPGRNFSWNYVYRPVSYKLESNLGSAEQFSEMVQRCKTVGVEIYADAVINHMSGGGGNGVTGQKFRKRDFEDVINGENYYPEDFHHLPDDTSQNCQIKFSGMFDTDCDRECMMNCDFPGLPDLDTGSPKVRGMITSYLNLLMDEGVSGVRIDAADHIGSTDLKAILDPMPHKRFRFFESRDEEDFLEKIKLGRVTQFKFKRNLMKSIVKEDLRKINYLNEQGGLVPSEAAVVFVLNHDGLMEEDAHGEGIFYTSPVLYTLGNVLMLALPYGYPKVISSFYFPRHEHTWPPPYNNVHGENGELRCGDEENWVCEHRWPAIANMVAWRKSAGTNDITLWTPGEEKSQVYFCRGYEACILVNAGKEDWTVTPNLSLPAGDYCDIIESDDVTACRLMSVDDEGHAHWKHGDATQVVVPAQSAVAMHIGAKV